LLKNFFEISDLSEKSLREIINHKVDYPLSLKKKNIGLIFEKYSTRTRLSFHVAINELGGNALDIRFNELNISRDESFEDTFRAMNCYLDGLIFRTSSHKKLTDASKFFDKPIINALSEKSHPCQIISDLFTLNENFKHLHLNILWMGDINNVCYSLIQATELIPELSLIICSPIDHISLKNVKVVKNLSDIDLSIINCVMTDVFISMNDDKNEKKIELLKPYSVNEELMTATSKDSVFMHCLPANVGMEVTSEVFKGSKSIVWKQAYNRLVAQKNLLNIIYN
tara:strand:+ start:55 stop:903 length:849 start_codon:yes stop_codon:yes gene_type:complete